MKITIWIRSGSDGAATLRLDTKLESLDTPVIQRYGFKLANAIEGVTDKGAPSAGAQSLKG